MIARYKIAGLSLVRLFLTLIMTAGALACASAANAQGQVEVLYTFESRGIIRPLSLIRGSDGNFYGTVGNVIAQITSDGIVNVLHTFAPFTSSNGLMQARDGNFYFGFGSSLFKMTPSGTVSFLSAFNVAAFPLVEATDGNFYGTTGFSGGGTAAGSVFRMTPGGDITILHTFTTDDYIFGCFPNSPLVQATDGYFYGTTARCGAGSGTMFRTTSSGSLELLYVFDPSFPPIFSLFQGTDGNLYGLTAGDDQSALGTVIQITLDGTATVFHTFTGEARRPLSLMQAIDGNFYGVSRRVGGTPCLNEACGTIFRLTPGHDFTVLHEFAGGVADGDLPLLLIQAADGNFYSATIGGGSPGCSSHGCGTFFRMTPSGDTTLLHRFINSPDGAFPGSSSALIQATDGNIYGTTLGGGSSDLGTVFRITPSGTLTILHAFAGGLNDGIGPSAALVQASDGNLYGTTPDGGNPGCLAFGSCGLVFRMNLDGDFTILHKFAGHPTDGESPQAALIQATDGNFYGATLNGGPGECFAGCGTIFRMTPNGDTTILHSFTGSPGRQGTGPSALIQARDGNFYGTTRAGGVLCSVGCGTIFKMTPDGTVTTIYQFVGGTDDASFPNGALIQAPDGNLYGTTREGGSSNRGTVFQITLDGVLTYIHSFAGSEGVAASPLTLATDGTFYGATGGFVFNMTTSGTVTALYNAGDGTPLLLGMDGKLYGTTTHGGEFGTGEVFRVSF